MKNVSVENFPVLSGASGGAKSISDLVSIMIRTAICSVGCGVLYSGRLSQQELPILALWLARDFLNYLTDNSDFFIGNSLEAAESYETAIREIDN